jgi:hypothetical protein
MDITLALMPDTYFPGYYNLASELAISGLTVEVLLLGSAHSPEVSSSNGTPSAPGIRVRTVHWNDSSGSRYLAHFYTAVYSRSSAVLIVGPGFQPDTATVISLLDLFRQGYDVIIVSRHHKMSTLNYPFLRWFFSKYYNRIASVLLGTKTTDATSGLKLYSKEMLIQSLGSATTKELTFQLEILKRARRLGAAITEVPTIIEYQQSPYAVKASDITQTVFETLTLWWRNR